MLKFIIVAVIIIAIIALILTNIRVVNQGHVMVIERLGAYHATWEAGLHFKIPFVDRAVRKISIKEQVADFPPQAAITKDNVMMTIDSVVYFKIFDAKLNTYGVENYIAAIENLTATTLRSLIGDMTLDDSLKSREHINAQMLRILDEATDNWGIKVTRVEVKNIVPPAQMQEAMEKQARAEREKRAAILKAEGEKTSTILRAEGEKEKMVLDAQAQNESMITIAQAKAETIRLEQEAAAAAIERLNAANANASVLTLKKLEALEKVADGQSTKIIIPSDLQGLAGLLETANAVIKES